MCFHNHGGNDYQHRNPAWLSGGREVDSPDGKRLAWGEPEVLLYDDDPLEDDGRLFATEMQKALAHSHEIGATLLVSEWGLRIETAAPS